MGGPGPANLGGRMEAEVRRAQGESFGSCEVGRSYRLGEKSFREAQRGGEASSGIRRPGQA